MIKIIVLAILINILNFSWTGNYEEYKEKFKEDKYSKKLINKVTEDMYTGIIIVTNEDGTVRKKCNYIKGKREGNCQNTNTYEIGNVTKTITVNANYKNGYIDGFRYEYINGNISSKELYKNRQKQGQQIYYFDNGNVERKEFYIDGEKEGLFTWYNENGNLIEKQVYKKDKKNGLSVSYDDNGYILKKETYLNNKKIESVRYEKETVKETENGEWIEYYANDKVKLKGGYINGLREGTWTYYREDGSIKK